MEDVELLKRMQKGDERAFAILFDKYKTRLYRHIFNRVRVTDATEDMVQTIFISLWRNCHNITITETLAPYLFKAARTQVLAHLLANAKEARRLSAVIHEQSYSDLLTAEDIVVAKEIGEAYLAIMEKLPDTMREVVAMRTSLDVSIKEIATRLGLSEQTVRNNLTEGRKRIKRKLALWKIVGLLLFVLI